ncbi:MAG: tRNA (N6-threonylcarbamoyladenosine(37)-N6)-methyltransferase TrmO [Sedimentisphaerales bacterium]|nr:tRNA (N6-threonylcarbamoyladenosine(37)-N6)-methyltransferase TrmO [Sedimentisphaerales bacterium]
MDANKIELRPIGTIYSPFQQAQGTPIQPAFAHEAEGIVEVFDEYVEGLKDLDGFERIWLLFWLDRCSEYKLTVTPYMDTEQRGLFSTRAPARPNPVGLSCVKLERIESNKLYIRELDILDGTPLLDIKPYSSKFDCFEVSRNGWLDHVKDKAHKADERFHR